jgi:hypothetical protein
MRSPARCLAAPCLALLLAAPAATAQAGSVLFHQKLSSTEGGFAGPLHDEDLFGIGTARLGDLDGDGTTELAVGAFFDDDGGPERGAVWILFLRPDGTVKAHTKISSTSGGFAGPLDDNDLFGWSVAGLGDLDGDGVPDLAAGGWLDDDGGGPSLDEDYGGIWILFLKPDGTVKSQAKISATQGGFTGLLEQGDRFGSSLSPLGDLDGDGVVDLAAGAIYDDDGGTNCGCVWILFLQLDGSVKAQRKLSNLEGGFSGPLLDNDRFGYSSAALGDLDGDGVVDLAAGAILDGDGGAQRGAEWILFLNADGTVKDRAKISSTQGGFAGPLDDADTFGRASAALGDLDRDGVLDLAVGAGGDDDGAEGAGAVWLLFLHPDGSVKSHAKLSATQGGFTGTLDDSDDFGQSAASLGDLDHDGVVDLSVGALLDDDGGPERGAVWILFLSDGIWTNLHAGLAGLGSPQLAGQGSLQPATPMTLKLSGALPNSGAVLVVGTDTLNLPFKGGVLVPEPLPGLLVPLVTNPLGTVTLSTTWPGGVPSGLSLYLQAWCVDAGGPQGVSASNALALTTP